MLPKRQPRPPSLSLSSESTGPGDSSPNPSSFGPPASDLDHPGLPELDGLPMRVRQASLAPQLRDQVTPVAAQQYVAAPEMPADLLAAGETGGGPSPEAARSLLSALQSGWERGRSMAEQMTDEPDGEQS